MKTILTALLCAVLLLFALTGCGVRMTAASDGDAWYASDGDAWYASDGDAWYASDGDAQYAPDGDAEIE